MGGCNSAQDPRELLTSLYRVGVGAVQGRPRVAEWLVANPPDEPVHIVAVGKAAPGMALGARDALDERIAAGLVITRAGYTVPEIDDDSRFRQLASAHPVPDERSLHAGRALTEFFENAPADARFLCLISGGASSLVELLGEGGTVQGLAALNRSLLARGYDIHAMNRARQAVSRIKGGRLAGWLTGRRAQVLLISDVRGDDPAIIGSGLLFPSDQPSTAEDIPKDLWDLCPPAPPADDASARLVEGTVIADNQRALTAIAEAARTRGLYARVYERFIDGEAEHAGETLAGALRAADPGLHVWGGEPTVTLPERPGRGGRMQALALAAAVELADDRRCWLLAAGSDGADGPTEDAGAVIDGATPARGAAQGLYANDHLGRADAGTFLTASGDLLRTGGTGTNVMDIMIGWKAC